MTQVQEKILELLRHAVERFNENEQYLLQHGLSERCICSKFSMYLERALADSDYSDYTVDVEYNRGMEGNPYAAKRLDDGNIVVDLIVHKRGDDEQYGFDNSFCAEMKKGRGAARLRSDKERLRNMTDPRWGFDYKAGFMLVIVNDRRNKKYYIDIDEMFLHNG